MLSTPSALAAALPRVQPKGVAPPLPAPRTVQRSLEEGEDTTNYLNIKITEPPFQTWTRDVETIDFEADLELFQQKVTGANPKIEYVGTHEGVGDHVEVFARTEGGVWIKMDLGVFGSRIIYPAEGPSGLNVDEKEGLDYTMKEGLTLHKVFREFFTVARSRRFQFGVYDCKMFAGALMGSLADYEDLFM